jgi:alkylation response protein AidB-like acyl-CoA dehydrogenase
VEATIGHLTATRFEQADVSLAQQPVSRAALARMRMTTDAARALRDDTLTALESGRDDAQLRVLEVKAVAAEAAIEVTEQAMRLCGGAAFRKEVGIERPFRDARAARVMAPTTDALEDFVGRALCGLPLLDEANV